MVAGEAINWWGLLFNEELSGFWKKIQFKEYFVDGVVEIPSTHVLNVKRVEGKAPCMQNGYAAKTF